MGIQGLLPALSPITSQKHLNDFRGKRAGIDGYVWLHRALYGCAYECVMELSTNKL